MLTNHSRVQGPPSMIDHCDQIYTAWKREFQRNRDLHGDRIQCRKGCSDCCHQLFQITEIEAARISLAVALWPEAEREALVEKARRYLEQRGELVARRGEPEAWGSLPPPGSRLPCPALVDGACSIYEARPLMCRKFGVPLWNPDRPGRVYACELNFREGEVIVDDQLIQIQTGLHQQWKAVQAGYNESGGYRDPHPITVARAIVEEFRL